jgi:hypothetical protein
MLPTVVAAVVVVRLASRMDSMPAHWMVGFEEL